MAGVVAAIDVEQGVVALFHVLHELQNLLRAVGRGSSLVQLLEKARSVLDEVVDVLLVDVAKFFGAVAAHLFRVFLVDRGIVTRRPRTSSTVAPCATRVRRHRHPRRNTAADNPLSTAAAPAGPQRPLPGDAHRRRHHNVSSSLRSGVHTLPTLTTTTTATPSPGRPSPSGRPLLVPRCRSSRPSSRTPHNAAPGSHRGCARDRVVSRRVLARPSGRSSGRGGCCCRRRPWGADARRGGGQGSRNAGWL